MEPDRITLRPEVAQIKRYLLNFASLCAVAIAACGSPVSSSSTGTPSAVLHGTLSVGGFERSYRLFRPSLNSAAKVPLVIALHEFGTTGDDMAALSRYDSQAEKNHFLVAYPNGVEGSWNAGNCCPPASDRGIDDVKFIRLLIDRVVSQQPVDSSRIFVTGYSNGAAMAHRLGCELADRIRAIASVSGALLLDACNPARPVSVLEIHGSKDAAFPVEGNTLGLSSPPLATEMQQWAVLNGCAPNPSSGGSAAIKVSIWASCHDNVHVKLELVEGGRHSWFATATSDSWQFFTS